MLHLHVLFLSEIQTRQGYTSVLDPVDFRELEEVTHSGTSLAIGDVNKD